MQIPSLGFSFCEIGTVTPHPQGGNAKPRLFRDSSRRALFNRMGFNNLGAHIVSERVRKMRENLPENFRVGVNIGKNKDTSSENAHEDYGQAAKAFENVADFLVINVSSPNTPGLRDLQALEPLKKIVERVLAETKRWTSKTPVLLKLAPEIEPEDLERTLREGDRWGIEGWVLTNTLKGEHEQLPGGWSGEPLKEISRQRLKLARSWTKNPIISVGGIDSVEEALIRKKLGADLVELYTGWIYAGPRLPRRIGKAWSSGS